MNRLLLHILHQPAQIDSYLKLEGLGFPSVVHIPASFPRSHLPSFIGDLLLIKQNLRVGVNPLS